MLRTLYFDLDGTIVHADFEGLRVTPSVYTMPQELERFCEAVEHVIAHGLPSA